MSEGYQIRSQKNAVYFLTYQAEYHAVELNNNEMSESSIENIHQNHAKAHFIEFENEYLQSSARSFLEIDGIIVVDAL